ncbi:MAG TPA: transposase [Pseudonocardiaceae bacterium]
MLNRNAARQDSQVAPYLVPVPADGRPRQRFADVEHALRSVHLIISSSFARAEPRLRALHYMHGLAGILVEPAQARRNIASGSGRHRTEGAQRLLTTAQWDEGKARARLRDLVLKRAGPGGILYVIEASFVKRGSSAVATERQCSVDSGWIESCQSAILLFYGTADGCLFLIDIDLYVPRDWVASEERRRYAKMPPNIVYRSKSRMARDMVDRATALGLAPERVVLSLFCAEKGSLLRWLQGRRTQYLAGLTAGEFRDLAAVGPVAANGMLLTDRSAARDSVTPYQTAAYYRAASRRALTDGDVNRMIAEARRMDIRWRSMRQQIRIDRYEVRGWRGWQRHMTLAMAAQIATELAGH